MSVLTFDVGMDLESLPEEHGVRRLVASGLERRGRTVPRRSEAKVHWDASFFGLDRVEAFFSAAACAQQRILERCGRMLLEEAFFIERAGVAFASKMVLLSQSIDERQLYGLFTADEASHFALISAFVPEPHLEGFRENGFLLLLDELIAEGGRAELQLLIQVVLEGWGLSHYRALRDGCHTPALKDAFNTILSDEAAHHGSGVLLTQDAELSQASRAFVLHALERMLSFVRCGPQGVLSILQAELGGFDRAERLATLLRLSSERESEERLRRLESLMLKSPASRVLVPTLRERGAFTPLSPEELT